MSAIYIGTMLPTLQVVSKTRTVRHTAHPMPEGAKYCPTCGRPATSIQYVCSHAGAKYSSHGDIYRAAYPPPEGYKVVNSEDGWIVGLDTGLEARPNYDGTLVEMDPIPVPELLEPLRVLTEWCEQRGIDARIVLTLVDV